MPLIDRILLIIEVVLRTFSEDFFIHRLLKILIDF